MFSVSAAAQRAVRVIQLADTAGETVQSATRNAGNAFYDHGVGDYSPDRLFFLKRSCFFSYLQSRQK